MYGEETRDRGLQAQLQVETKENLVTESSEGVRLWNIQLKLLKSKNFCWGSAPNPAETQPPSGAGPRTPSGHQYFVQILHSLIPPQNLFYVRTGGLRRPRANAVCHSVTPNMTISQFF